MIVALLTVVGVSLLCSAAVCWLADRAGVNRVLDRLWPLEDEDAYHGNGWGPYTRPEDERRTT